MVFGHVKGSFEVKEENMKKYFAQVKSLLSRFTTTWLEKVDRKHNQKANELSKAIVGKRLGKFGWNL